ncbi:hypothetical protein LCGC14_0977540 [marine sediment metagenome]|uniref:Energy transducer TonB n=1 Tax=marine sediment metagenome TaxID=412755 RepID=A0A0F9QT71_9ZZZZ|nr:hypothetical protein [Halopseudomonas sabulinigri]
MQEQTRLAYLEALGVINWMPRQALAGIPPRMPYTLPVAAVKIPVASLQAELQSSVVAPINKLAVDPVGAVKQLRADTVQPKLAPAAEAPIGPPALNVAPIEPFYLQLWLAGPCALLTEAPEPGLESATPAFLLLQDILRAVGLPPRPRLLADFRWPLSRNPQLDRSAEAANRGLLAFMQGRLEEHEPVSLGCFGPATGLLVETDLAKVDQLQGREVALDHLPAAWFAADLELLMREPQRKAELWAQLRRIKTRWQGKV